VIDVIIIGGGLSGLTNAILLKKAGLSVTLFEEKKYPFHRVCGEYISNEVIPFLEKENLFPSELIPSTITQFQLTSPTGNALSMKLDLGGFGVSRYSYDLWLSEKAQEAGVIIIHERVVSCNFNNDEFTISTNSDDHYQSKFVIGAFGKRSFLDKKMDRNFINKRSPYIGVKYHIKNEELEQDTIALHNFQDGYCGVSKIENDTFNLCYLSHRNNLKIPSSLSEMEEVVLKRNPFLNKIFNDSTFLFEKPEVINEISFEKKEPVFNHVLMSGDSAGMIAPLCGNGMAMAIHSAKVLSELIIKHGESNSKRENLEEDYTKYWEDQFAKRLWAGRKIQSLFGSKRISEWAVALGKSIPSFTKYLMSQTHGKPFN
jgi:menaquinone-9 beta-reductase